ncbi:MAG: YicC family protein [Nitrospirales bacterium]|nr:YicC family protein [Nitrospirales bacterium]
MGREATAMIISMTGYGRSEEAWSGGTVTAELRSVNHRFCEIVVRLPKAVSSLEEELKRMIQQRCARGRIELTVSLSGGKEAGKQLTLDQALARQYHSLLRDLKKQLRLSGSIDVAMLAGYRDLISVSDRPVDEKRLLETAKRVTTEALSMLDQMRRREGAALAKDLKHRLHTVREEIGHVEKRCPHVAQEHLARLKARVAKLVELPELDEGRLSQELALYADRCDISEEVTRLASHLAQCETTLRSEEPVGRTLDFLLQEIGREVNTIGSKANDADIAMHVVKLKGELEKIREQVQNIE